MIFSSIGTEPPELVKKMMENKMHTVLMLFLVSSFAQKLLVTGAFEISYNGNLIFSKLETGQVPSGPMIENVLNKAMRISAGQGQAHIDL